MSDAIYFLGICVIAGCSIIASRLPSPDKPQAVAAKEAP